MKSNIQITHSQFIDRFNRTHTVNISRWGFSADVATDEQIQVLVEAVQDLFLIVEAQRKEIEELRDKNTGRAGYPRFPHAGL